MERFTNIKFFYFFSGKFEKYAKYAIVKNKGNPSFKMCSSYSEQDAYCFDTFLWVFFYIIRGIDAQRVDCIKQL